MSVIRLSKLNLRSRDRGALLLVKLPTDNPRAINGREVPLSGTEMVLYDWRRNSQHRISRPRIKAWSSAKCMITSQRYFVKRAIPCAGTILIKYYSSRQTDFKVSFLTTFPFNNAHPTQNVRALVIMIRGVQSRPFHRSPPQAPPPA